MYGSLTNVFRLTKAVFYLTLLLMLGVIGTLTTVYFYRFSTPARHSLDNLQQYYERIEQFGFEKKLNPQSSVPVLEFFSFDCYACHQIEPMVQAWVVTQPRNTHFEQIPLYDKRLLRTLHVYYSARRCNPHTTAILFQYMTEGKDINDFITIKNLLCDLNITSVTPEQLKKLNIEEIQINRGKKLEAYYNIEEVPCFVVGGRYKTSLAMVKGDYLKLFQVLDHLVKKVRDGIN